MASFARPEATFLRSGVFDVYEGAQVGEGKKSLALRLSFRAPDRTLSDDEVNELRARIIAQCGGTTWGRELRA